MKTIIICLALVGSGAFAQSDESWQQMHQNAELENMVSAIDYNTQAVQCSVNCKDQSAEVAKLKQQVELLKELNRRGVKIP